ncbi:hypothetical protein HN747_00250 [archaeon]|nr:hypothetical protein [archaeon]
MAIKDYMSKDVVLTTIIASAVYNSYFRAGEFSRERFSTAREQKVIEFYQNHGRCPSDLNARQLDERADLWIGKIGGRS